MAYMNVGGAYYVAKNWRTSTDFLESKYKIVSKGTKLEFLRTLILNYAYQNDYENFKRIFKRSIELLDSANELGVDNIASLMEAVSRSLSIFGFIKEARQILMEAKTLNVKPFYQSQIIRGQVLSFYYGAKRGKKINRDYLVSFAKEAFQERYHPYKRHKQQIKNILKILRVS